MTFIFQFYDSIVKFVQMLLQFLDFVLNRKTRKYLSTFARISARIAKRLPSLGCRAVMAPPNCAVDYIIL
jgi:hypothetical protein